MRTKNPKKQSAWAKIPNGVCQKYQKKDIWKKNALLRHARHVIHGRSIPTVNRRPLLIHPVDCDTLYQVFSRIGKVRKVVLQTKAVQLQGFVEMETAAQAAEAKARHRFTVIFCILLRGLFSIQRISLEKVHSICPSTAKNAQSLAWYSGVCVTSVLVFFSFYLCRTF